MGKTILITGASSGIGRSCALKLDSLTDVHFILCGRQELRLLDLQKELRSSSEILVFDVKSKQEVFDAIGSLNLQSLDILINNAGNAHGLATFDEMELSDMEEMIMGNVLGLIYVTKACMPALIQSSQGHIINLSSIAGKETYRSGTVYCASKAAVESLSQGMRMDLVDKGIKVTNVAPGAVNTNFSKVRFKGDQARADAVYDGFIPLAASDVADAILYAVTVPESVQIADMTILPRDQASATLIHRE